MEKRRLAGLDIGTNTILLLIADIDENGNIDVIRDEHNIARLGEGVDKTGIINVNALERACSVLREYRVLCDEHGVEKINTGATSALRDARNSAEIREKLAEIIGTRIRVLSGEKEAEISFMGTVRDDDHSVVLDIGGGSTEIIKGTNRELESRKSLQTGAVRLTERFFSSQPPSEYEIIQAVKAIRSELNNIDIRDKDIKYYAVAGTPTTIAAVSMGLADFEREKIEGYMLSLDEMIDVLEIFFKSDTEHLITKLNIHPKRADVITAGGLILKEFTSMLGFSECIVSTRGLRFGLLLEAARI